MDRFRRRARDPVDQQLSNWTWRRTTSWSLFVLAGIVALQHLLAHAGWRPVPLSMGWQDVFMGYPAALLLAILGGVLMDPNPRL